LVVYADDTDNPLFRSRSQGLWSAPATVFATPPGAGIVLWIELVSHPMTDEITLLYAASDGRLHAVVWDGNAFDEANTATTLSTTLSTVTGSRPFDAAYEQVSGDLLVALGHTSASDDIRYATRASGTDNFAVQTLVGALAVARIVRLAAEPGSDRIALGLSEGTGGGATNVVGMLWDGTMLSTPVALDSTAAADDADLAIGWVGTSGTVVVVYKDADGGGGLDWASCTTNGAWTLHADLPVAAMGDFGYAVARPLGGDRLMLVVGDSTAGLFVLTFDGLGWTVTNAGAALQTTLSSTTTRAFDVAGRGD
jgi:hypothetical protein